MGKGKKGGKRGGPKGGGAVPGGPKREEWKDIVMENEKMEGYYKGQQVVPEEQWDAFMAAMREPLPSSFRVTGNKNTASELNTLIKNTYIPILSSASLDGQQLPPPKQLPWYPDGLAWQLNLTKTQIRKSPEFKRFQNFLVYETEAGNISRQEAVSMIPPLLLDVQPHHVTIDMCAAPGSKTAQLLEALHADPSNPTPSGLVVANDSDNKRAYMLVHQVSRLPSPSLLVTNVDAQRFPTLYRSATPGDANPTGKKRVPLLFDRVLCDVPCSGDGTIRKNVQVWSSWTPQNGNGLHSLQLRILLRGIAMLKPGGRLVYSTCSMNPIENEAVVAAALAAHPEMQLVDVSSHLPELVRRPGLKTWKVCVDRETGAFAPGGRDEFIQSLPEGRRERIKAEEKLPESMWPPSPQKAREMGLEKCIRVYAHLQDTGAFFIAVLEKKAAPTLAPAAAPAAPTPVPTEVLQPAAAEASSTEPAVPLPVEATSPTSVSKRPAPPASPSTAEAEPRAKRAKGEEEDVPTAAKELGPDRSFKEDPYSYLSPEDENVQSCINFFNLTPDFPSSTLLVRNPVAAASRTLYLTSPLVRDIIENNDYTRFRLVSCGTKILVKQEVGKGAEAAVTENEGGFKCKWRVTSEGLPLLRSYIPEQRVMHGSLADLRLFVENYRPLIEALPETSALRVKLLEADSGSHVALFDVQSEENGLREPVLLPLWKSRVSMTLMIDKKERSALSLRLFGEDITEAGRAQAVAAQEREVRKAAAAAVSASGEGSAAETPAVEKAAEEMKMELEEKGAEALERRETPAVKENGV